MNTSLNQINEELINIFILLILDLSC